MATSQQAEVERKYEVEATSSLPVLIDVDGVSKVGQPLEAALEAVYFDTADLDLARRGVTLRRRTGGEDAGWHLKLPAGTDERTEVRLPLGRGAKTVPAGLLDPVRAVVRDRPLVPVARVSTRRLEYPLLRSDDVVLAHVCDDKVRAERLHGSPLSQEWREWEVELAHGDRSVLDAVETCLVRAGAKRASVGSKLARTLDSVVPPTPRRPSRKRLARGSAAQLLSAHLSEHIDQLHEQDARLRADHADSVHKMRIAARRLRSALTTYRPLFQSGVTGPIRQELRWLGQELGVARDAQVLRERLGELVASEPDELVLGPVARRLDDELSAALSSGREQALAALDSDRYLRLLDALDELVRSEPLTPKAEKPARDVVAGLLQRDGKRLRRSVRDVDRAPSSAERDAALHEARKKAKRLRYAAESAVPVLGARAKRLAKSAKKVQQALGEHQDAVVARGRLRDYGIQAHLSGENGFTFGRLHALQQRSADEAEQQFERAWSKLPHKKLRKWLRS